MTRDEALTWYRAMEFSWRCCVRKFGHFAPETMVLASEIHSGVVPMLHSDCDGRDIDEIDAELGEFDPYTESKKWTEGEAQ